MCQGSCLEEIQVNNNIGCNSHNTLYIYIYITILQVWICALSKIPVFSFIPVFAYSMILSAIVLQILVLLDLLQRDGNSLKDAHPILLKLQVCVAVSGRTQQIPYPVVFLPPGEPVPCGRFLEVPGDVTQVRNHQMPCLRSRSWIHHQQQRQKALSDCHIGSQD